jgi:hypothetical protein
MKHKFLFCVVFLMVGLSAAFAQQKFTMTIVNDAQISATEYQADVYLLNTGTDAIELSGIQMGFLFNASIKNAGTITCSWVPGSNDAALVTAGMVNTSFNATATYLTYGVIKIAGKLPAGGAGSGAIMQTVAPGTRVGRLKMVNTLTFGADSAALKYSFSTTPYATKVSSYIAGINTDITANGTFVTTLGNPVLPVELSSFTTSVQGRTVSLNWETKTEVNTNKFEVERSLVSDKTSTWVSVASVQAAGNSNSPRKYSYSEKNMQAGKYQYRLRMVDNDGTFKYSDAVETEVALPKNFDLSQNYPNPFNPSTKIDYQVPVDAKVILEVYNIAGQRVAEVVNQNQAAGYYTVDFGSSYKLASGVYIYRMAASENATGKNFSSIKKMMLLK